MNFTLYISALYPSLILEHLRLLPDWKISILTSFMSASDADIIAMLLNGRPDGVGSVLKDSGTFEANNNKNSGITIKAYVKDLLKYGPLYDVYANFDLDHTTDGAVINLQNQCFLESLKLTPMYVSHNPFGDELKMIIDKGYNYIGIPARIIGTKKIREKIMVELCDAGVDVHYLGSTSFDIITESKDYRIRSCDSARWAAATKFGEVYYWDPAIAGANKGVKIHLGNRIGSVKVGSLINHDCRDRFLDYIGKTLEIDYTSLQQSTELQYLVNVHFMLQLEKAINDFYNS